MTHETIYLYIWDDKTNGGSLWCHLRGASKQRRKRYARKDSRGRLAGKRMIGERPAVVNRRRRYGDWELDTVHGRGKPRSEEHTSELQSQPNLVCRLLLEQIN